MAETEKRLYEKGAKCGRTKQFLDYLWNVQIEMSKSYAFDFSHSHEYSTECLQELNLYYKYPKVYWNTAVVITQAQTGDERENSATAINYGKIAQSIYKARKNGVVVNSPNINESNLSFSIDEKEESILYGLGAISGINNDIANQVIKNRPYNSFEDFYSKNSYQNSLVTNSKFIALIKAGCFDVFESDRTKVMRQFIFLSTTKKTNLTTANLSEAIRIGARLPKTLLAPYNFRKYVCSKQFLYGNHPNFKSKKLYWLDQKALKYFNANCIGQLQEEVDWWVNEEGQTILVDKSLDRLFAPVMQQLKEYINSEEFIKNYNKLLLKSKYEELVPNNDPNHWSFEATSFYSQEHELSNINRNQYSINLFDEIPEEPEFVLKFMGKREWRQYNLYRIAGVVVDRNDNNHLLTILDMSNNIVQCKFTAFDYAKYKQQISVPDGKGGKTVVDPSWFKRGQGLILTGYRYGESDFKVKAYKSSVYRKKVKKIEFIDNETGEIVVKSNRYGYGDEENE